MPRSRVPALGPRRGSTCPHPQPPAPALPTFPLFEARIQPRASLLRASTLFGRPQVSAWFRNREGNLLVAVGASHPTPDIEANPKQEGAGADQRGDAYGEDRLLHEDINLNGSRSVPVDARPRSWELARRLGVKGRAASAGRPLLRTRPRRCPSWNSRNAPSSEARPMGVRSGRAWGEVRRCHKPELRRRLICCPMPLPRGLGQTGSYERRGSQVRRKRLTEGCA